MPEWCSFFHTEADSENNSRITMIHGSAVSPASSKTKREKATPNGRHFEWPMKAAATGCHYRCGGDLPSNGLTAINGGEYFIAERGGDDVFHIREGAQGMAAIDD
jgi:hypothetical protein